MGPEGPAKCLTPSGRCWSRNLLLILPVTPVHQQRSPHGCILYGLWASLYIVLLSQAARQAGQFENNSESQFESSVENL